ncbi:hypothetical protein LTR05_000147 [Lithohypha guttulata]|uniref:Mediator of RNA polymerase II transcription subunit 19 n=1 Tax=Lithohypha guttulata TaxID=1690604 RepID=A0AAN7T425_9EURO|nr:hypothetical protein LTR05_000147 [Lithohypha guttulata]
MSYHSTAPRLPLSPASPPESGVKQQPILKGPVVTPQTPPYPDHMSVATKRYVSPYQDSRHTNEMADLPSENYINQPPRASISSATPQQQTTLKRPLSQDEDERPMSKRQKREGTEEGMRTELSSTSTNHDRQKESQQEQDSRPNVSSEVQSPLEEVSGKDKAELDSIFKDVGPALRLRNTSRKGPLVDTSKHILGTYGLHDLLSGMARTDPSTGEKINKLRKSYEGQIKTAGLSGRNRPWKEPRAEDSEHSNMYGWSRLPPERFAEDQVESKVGDIDSLRRGMGSALQLNSGTMPPKMIAEWDDVLGHEAKRPAAPQHTPSQQQSRIPNGVRPAQHLTVPSDKIKTRGKKRSYGDHTFDGYTGYADGYSEPDHSDGDRDYADRGKKRRKD